MLFFGTILAKFTGVKAQAVKKMNLQMQIFPGTAGVTRYPSESVSGRRNYKMHPAVDDFCDFLRSYLDTDQNPKSFGYVTIDDQWKITRANTRAATMLGVEKDRLIRSDFLSFINVEDRQENNLGTDQFEDLAHRSFDVRIARENDLSWIRISILLDEDSFFHTRQLGLILQDISCEKQVEAEITRLRLQLRQAHKMKVLGEFSGGIVHDLNNILQPIIVNLEMLIEDTAGDRKLKKTLQKVLTGANRASCLTNQILNFSHQEEDDISSVRIQTVLQEVLKLSRSILPESINIVQSIDKDCGPVMADSIQIYQVAMNLITNAMHAMENGGGTLDVGLREIEVTGTGPSANTKLSPGMYACLSVSDTGVGIDGDIYDKIFEPFFTAREKGTGLGLSILNGIVEKYGGETCFSSTPGKGSLFQVYLPIQHPPSGRALATPRAQKDLCGSESVLLVEDDPSIVDIQKEILERYGYRVTACYNGRDALDEFRANPEKFDIIVCDMTMPEMNGLDFARRIKEIKSNMPVVISTGYSNQINQDNYIDLGLDGFLMKPVNKDHFLKLIRNLLDI